MPNVQIYLDTVNISEALVDENISGCLLDANISETLGEAISRLPDNMEVGANSFGGLVDANIS